MLFTRVASMLTVLTFGLVVLANPVEKEERQLTDPLSLVTGLLSSVTSVTAPLQGVTTGSAANTELAQSVVSQLISTLGEVTAQAGSGSLTSAAPGTDTAVADALGSVVSTLGEVLSPVVVIVPEIGPSIAEIDVALNGLVVSLDVVVTGLVLTLNSLLVGVAGILNGLGLTILLATLGL